MQLAKDGRIAYNKDRKRKAIPPRRTARSSGIALAEWMYGFLEPAPPYGLPEEMYNDVMPSGVHRYNRYNDGL
mgnify:CR=1 FL=1